MSRNSQRRISIDGYLSQNLFSCDVECTVILREYHIQVSDNMEKADGYISEI